MATFPPGTAVYAKRPLPATADELPPFLSRELGIVERAIRDTRLFPTQVVTDDYTIADADGVVIVDTTGGSVTVTLPDVRKFWGRTFMVKRNGVSAHTVTVDGGAATIDGIATYVMNTAYESVTVFSDGTEWLIL